jgi:hypothetical protein
MFSSKTTNGNKLVAWRGDAKTLLAFDVPKAGVSNLAGFTIQCRPQGKPAYYLYNMLQFVAASGHAQVATEPAYSSINAPIQKFRWLHVPGSYHQPEGAYMGTYTYTVTPRYFDKGKLLPIDLSKSVSVDIEVSPFEKDKLRLGFTRGFVQSQAFVSHFGLKPQFLPDGELVFDTTQVAGTDNHGQSYTFQDEYTWSGYTARQVIFDVLNEVLNDGTLTIDVFAYDLNEPDILNIFLALARVGRIRIILDNASLHHDNTGKKNEDQFQVLFNKAAVKDAEMKRGHFGSFAHDKVFVVRKNDTPVKVLCGSTNFSVSGMYVNANHVLVFNDASTAQLYANVFDEAWQDDVSEVFNRSQWANKLHPLSILASTKANVSFSPHGAAFALSNLQSIADRVGAEKSSVLFAVMALNNGGGPVLPELMALHKSQNIFSYGISDAPGGISLYKPGSKTGILVTGKSAKAKLPPPFSQEAGIGSYHEIHHKFIVCGFNTKDAVVYCGSSNLALGGEEKNGDNLLAIYDQDVATVFAIEAASLVDHFHFRNRTATGKMNLYTDSKWAQAYFNTNDLHCDDRLLFTNQ